MNFRGDYTIGDVYFNSEDTGVYYRRLLRDGWMHIENKGNAENIFEKNLPKDWSIQKIAHEGGSGDGHGCYWDEHALINKRESIEFQHHDWEWAEQDKNDIVWASKGCLYRAKINSKKEIGEPRLLHNFNGYVFEEVQAPY